MPRSSFCFGGFEVKVGEGDFAGVSERQIEKSRADDRRSLKVRACDRL